MVLALQVCIDTMVLISCTSGDKRAISFSVHLSASIARKASAERQMGLLYPVRVAIFTVGKKLVVVVGVQGAVLGRSNLGFEEPTVLGVYLPWNIRLSPMAIF